MFPDFIGIGAQKAGTTWLYQNLRVHPQVWIPRKEIHYFDQKIHDTSFDLKSKIFGKSPEDRRWRGQVKYWTKVNMENRSLSGLLWAYKYLMRPPGDDWYGSLFEPRKGRIAGEITPNYSTLEADAVAHVHELVPDAKILFMMRNPIERAWSQAVMKFDRAKGRDIRTAVERKIRKNFDNEGSRSRTGYLRTIETWRRFYPEEQIFVGFLEDIGFFPAELLRSVYGFLGVDPSFEPPEAREKVHSRSAGEIPVSQAAYLARAYRGDIARLEERFGGYASFWAHCAERLIEEPPADESLPYPLWGSPMWEEWVGGSEWGSGGGRGPSGPQSGPLTSVRSAGEDR